MNPRSCQPRDRHGSRTRRSVTYAPFWNPTGVDGLLVGGLGTVGIAQLLQQVPQGDRGRWRLVGVPGVDGLLVGGLGTVGIAQLLQQVPEAARG